MKFPKISYAVILCFCLCAIGLLLAAQTPAAVEEPPPKQDLFAAEQALQQHQDELASLLRAYYMGHAGERETKRLIEQVEEERLQVEALRLLHREE